MKPMPSLKEKIVQIISRDVYGKGMMSVAEVADKILALLPMKEEVKEDKLAFIHAKDVRIKELEEEVRKLRLLNDTLTNNVMVEDSPALKVMVETADHLSKELKNQSDYAVACIAKVTKDRDTYKAKADKYESALREIVEYYETITAPKIPINPAYCCAKQSLGGK